MKELFLNFRPGYDRPKKDGNYIVYALYREEAIVLPYTVAYGFNTSPRDSSEDAEIIRFTDDEVLYWAELPTEQQFLAGLNADTNEKEC